MKILEVTAAASTYWGIAVVCPDAPPLVFPNIRDWAELLSAVILEQTTVRTVGDPVGALLPPGHVDPRIWPGLIEERLMLPHNRCTLREFTDTVPHEALKLTIHEIGWVLRTPKGVRFRPAQEQLKVVIAELMNTVGSRPEATAMQQHLLLAKIVEMTLAAEELVVAYA